MIRYAGFEPPAERPKRKVWRKWELAGRQFRQGKDTLQIAEHWHISEPVAHRFVTRERCLRLGLPLPEK